MSILEATPQAIRHAAAIIRNGGVGAFPTEMVYGLGADALNATAVAKIFAVKNRPRFDPLIVHIADFSELQKLCGAVDVRAFRLVQHFWPGPLTLVLPKSDIVPDIVTAGLATVAVRMPDHNVALELIRAAATPIAAPSANPFGYLSPTTAEHVQEQIRSKVELILDGGPCLVGVESTILDLTGEEPVLLRAGGLAVEAIEQVIGRVEIQTGNAARPLAPGQFPRHYSPQTPLIILEDKQNKFRENERIGLLAFKPPAKEQDFEVVEVLSLQGNLQEAAANLFTCLHRLDKAGLDVIFAEPVTEAGLGGAIMDRLRRASTRRTKIKKGGRKYARV